MRRQIVKWMIWALCASLLMLVWRNTAAAQAGDLMSMDMDVATNVDTLTDTTTAAPEPKEHSEFDATLFAPFHAAPGNTGKHQRTQGRSFIVSLAYPDARQGHAVRWQLTLSGPDAYGPVVRQWSGRAELGGGAGAGASSNINTQDIELAWDGRIDDSRMRAHPHGAPARGQASRPLSIPPLLATDGLYQVRLIAVADEGTDNAAVVEQQWPILVDWRGTAAAPRMPAFSAFSAFPFSSTTAASPHPVDGALPYKVVYANLHSQTRHSDGGGPLATCHGAQAPQSAPFGPLDAYLYAQQHGLDVLLTSEHNHLYDGSDGTNGAADPADAKALYQAGLLEAAAYTAAHPGFLALYGLEWGVINKGGHLNILNSDQLLGWERNAHGELLADLETPKSDYAALYTLMHERYWIGQFNHPASAGQFVVDGQALGYSADGDAVMALCEVMNTSAFSNNDSETETRRSNYEDACNRALEAGYHVAFSSDQDNHCANWGSAYGNRTAVLIAGDTPLTRDSLFEALRARRVFATMDKQARLLFTANGQLMGTRFDNNGPLLLATYFSNDAGKQVSAVTLFHGVPGRNGNVTPLSDQASISITPSPGPHFYYARLVQDDGNIVWSAPIWVMQAAGTSHALQEHTADSTANPLHDK